MGKQVRSENTYQKINTLFFRDENNIIMPYDDLIMSELEYLRDCKFDAEEKIDGTNTRIEVTHTQKNYVDQVTNFEYEDTGIPYEITWSVSYKGKTDNSDVPKLLMEHIQTNYPEDKVLEALGLKKIMSVDDEFTKSKGWVIENESKSFLDFSKIPQRYTLYGEGYGMKIQKCGSEYLKDSNSFRGFDVKVDNMYLLKENRDDIFNKLGCPLVPFIGQFTIDEAIKFVKNGFKSKISENPDFMAEGLVLRTPIGLLNRRGNRIIFKLKTCDFQKYYNKYGTYEKVEQHRNPNLNLE